MLKSKKILFGLTGGIAIYKSASLIRHLVTRYEAEVSVIMTAAAQRFMSPLIFETFTGKPVMTDLFQEEQFIGTRHIDVARDCDILLVSPATANIIAKTAHGIADDLLSTVILTTGKKTAFVLAMNDDMYHNPVTQENIRKLEELGYGILHPIVGDLACNTTGQGHIPDEEEIVEFVDARLNGRNRWKGKHVLVTAGPTREFIDDIRYISNPASGKMGYAIAREAINRGAGVILISGPTHLKPPAGCDLVSVTSAEEMAAVVYKEFDKSDILFMTAAVEDIKPGEIVQGKIKKEAIPEFIPVIKNPDILKELGRRKKNQFLIGFSVETESVIENSRKKLEHKNLDLIVANNPEEDKAGFAVDTNRVTILSSTGEKFDFPVMSKRMLAKELCELVDRKIGKDIG